MYSLENPLWFQYNNKKVLNVITNVKRQQKSSWLARNLIQIILCLCVCWAILYVLILIPQLEKYTISHGLVFGADSPTMMIKFCKNILLSLQTSTIICGRFDFLNAHLRFQNLVYHALCWVSIERWHQTCTPSSQQQITSWTKHRQNKVKSIR